MSSFALLSVYLYWFTRDFSQLGNNSILIAISSACFLFYLHWCQYVASFQAKASLKRTALLEALGRDPEKTRIVGYFHPYWYAYHSLHSSIHIL